MSERTWLIVNIKQRLLDQYIEKWRSDVDIGVTCYNYRFFTSDFKFEKYLLDLPDALKYIVCKFRTVNHKLLINTSRYTRIPRNERVCKMCNSVQLGDEFHFCLECPALKELRNKFLPANISKRPNVINFGCILNIKNTITLVNVNLLNLDLICVLIRYFYLWLLFAICSALFTLLFTYGLEK